MTAVTPAAGLADAQARVAQIRARIGQLSPQASSAPFTLETPATGTTGAVGGTGGYGTSATVAAGDATAPLASLAAAPSSSRAVPSGTGSGDASAAQLRLEQVLPEAGKRWAGPIADAASKHGLDAGLLAALVKHESGFDPAARSHAGAIGLGQLMPGTAAGLGVDPTDPTQNLDGAARYLKQQLDRFGTADLALAAYNAGPNRVAQAGGVPNITETRNYVDRVLKTWEQYR